MQLSMDDLVYKQVNEVIPSGKVIGFTFELFWKVLKEFALREGLDPRSPRASIETALELGLIRDEKLFLEMLESRNLASHTYLEENAEDFYSELPAFLEAMGAAVSAIKQIRERCEKRSQRNG